MGEYALPQHFFQLVTEEKVAFPEAEAEKEPTLAKHLRFVSVVYGLPMLQKASGCAQPMKRWKKKGKTFNAIVSCCGLYRNGAMPEPEQMRMRGRLLSQGSLNSVVFLTEMFILTKPPSPI